jgi:hypothetical protein
MAEARSKKTGEWNVALVGAQAEIASLKKRVEHLESELVAIKTALSRVPKRPPPLPTTVSMPPKTSARKSVVDISEIAELVESIPPPPPRSGPPRPGRR